MRKAKLRGTVLMQKADGPLGWQPRSMASSGRRLLLSRPVQFKATWTSILSWQRGTTRAYTQMSKQLQKRRKESKELGKSYLVNDILYRKNPLLDGARWWRGEQSTNRFQARAGFYPGARLFSRSRPHVADQPALIGAGVWPSSGPALLLLAARTTLHSLHPRLQPTTPCPARPPSTSSG